MLNTRTTISLPEELLFDLKKKALIERRTLKEVISEGLKIYLDYGIGEPFNKLVEKETMIVNKLFGSWGRGLGGVAFVKKTRNNPQDRKRENNLKRKWKKF